MKLDKRGFLATACVSILSIALINVVGFTIGGHVSAAEVCNPSAITIDMAVCMQDINDSVIDSMVLDEQYQLTDVRDAQTYYVVKLKDGNVWMSQNLKLYLNNEVALTSETSDLNDSVSEAYQNGYTTENGVIKWSPTNNTIGFDGVTVTGWDLSDTAPYSASQNGDASTGHGMYGNYYNWSSAIASNDSTAFSESTFDDISKTPKNSICPKRWRLPTTSSESPEKEGSTNEFARLNQLYNGGRFDTDEGLLAAPLYLVRAGYIRFGLHSQNIAGNYWSGTIDSPENAFYLGFHSSSVSPGDDYKSYGRSVRCIARTGFSADTSDDEKDDNSVLVPDTGANQETLDFSNGSTPILGSLVSSIIGVFGFIVLKKRARKIR